MASDLLEVMQAVRAAANALRSAANEQPKNPDLHALNKAIDSLGQSRQARPLTCPDEYKLAWQSVRKGGDAQLSQRTIRYLAWEPDVVLSIEFHAYLDDKGIELSASGIQGFVRSCHASWPDFLKNIPLQGIASRRLQAYKGVNRVVTRWKESSGRILGPNAPDLMAAAMLDGLKRPSDIASDWSVDGSSTFFVETIRAVLTMARIRWRENGDIRSYVFREILPWAGWPIEVLKSESAECILHQGASSQDVKEPLQAFVLRSPHLGDPRLPRNATKWLGVRAEAAQRLIEWLSRADIIFFFDHAFPTGGDKHHRKPFWLKYVSRVIRSRPLLGQDDAARLQRHQRQPGGEVGNFGKLNGMNSAFLLDFGNICAIEFNQVGACYVYDRKGIDRVVSDFWSRGYFNESSLKKRDLAVDRIIHNPGWEEKMAQLLARYGVRPG